MSEVYDVGVVGAGIVGLAHAWAAARLGKRVVVIERDAQATGASIRNFGFVTVTGQQAGDCWERARRAREVWAEAAQAAGIPILQRGLLVTARRPEAEAVIDAFLATDMGDGCRRVSPAEAAAWVPAIRQDHVTAALQSPHELRVESRTAVPRLAAWLAEALGVSFHWDCAVHGVIPPRVETSRGPISAETVIVCPGDDTRSLFAERLSAYGIGRTKLQMLRLVPERDTMMQTALMSDLGLARYRGYADLPEAIALQARLDAEQPDQRRAGVHLIAVRSSDGSLVVGDSHEDGETPDPFISERINRLILDELDAVVDLGPYRLNETWAGTYAKASDRWRVIDAPDDATRVVVVTAGCGASTAFGIAEETLSNLYGKATAA